jgi:hypothetical protein
MSEPGGSWPSDDEFVGALVAFVERARSATAGSSVMLDAWMRDDDPARELVNLLKRDSVVAKHLAAGRAGSCARAAYAAGSGRRRVQKGSR